MVSNKLTQKKNNISPEFLLGELRRGITSLLSQLDNFLTKLNFEESKNEKTKSG
jgi:hypothetical protein